jgi:two-component system response regulator AtoC
MLMESGLTNTERETSVLLVDPNGTAPRSLSLNIGKEKYRIKVAVSADAAEEMLVREPFDIVLIDSVANQTSALETIRRIRSSSLYTEVIVLTESSDDRMAVQALKAGAFDCISKPYSSEQLLLRLGWAAERRKMRQELTALRQEAAMSCSFDNLVGISEAMTQLKETIRRIAPTDIPVLITGFPGTGKGLLARVIHHHSNRRRGPFVRIDCSEVDGTRLETALFGSAESTPHLQRAGLSAALEKVDGGTLFLDAVDRMPLSVQSRLLRFLQDFKVKPAGSGAEKKVDLRPIAATEKDLSALAAKGRFREDLLYRLGAISLKIPALVERIEDIELLADYLLRRIAADSGKKQPTISRQALDKLSRHTWPGNVRELENTLKRALVLCEGDHLNAGDFSLVVSGHRENADNRTSPSSVLTTADSLLEDNQRAVIKKALADNNWHFTQTAQALGIGRTTLWRKVKKYDLKRDTVPS